MGRVNLGTHNISRYRQVVRMEYSLSVTAGGGRLTSASAVEGQAGRKEGWCKPRTQLSGGHSGKDSGPWNKTEAQYRAPVSQGRRASRVI